MKKIRRGSKSGDQRGNGWGIEFTGIACGESGGGRCVVDLKVGRGTGG